MNPQSISYRSGVITWFDSARYGYRADVHYQTIGTFRTLAAAKAAITREHKAWRQRASAEHHAAIKAIWA